jgi:dTDP-4-dehydrorhamnose 3,5-epimerase
MLKILTTKLKNVLMLKREYFEDHRGTYEPIYNYKDYNEVIEKEIGEKIIFLEDDIAISSKNVLRGLHGDDRTWKLVTCLKGRYFINVLNYDKDSIDFGKYESFVLSEYNKIQLLIPPKHGHGYVVMSDEAIFHYKQSCIYRGIKEQFTIQYNDSRFNMWWPIDNPILSKRDQASLSI